MDKKRYLIIGPGRSGSSVLAGILADTGANFNMPVAKDWHRGSGAYEHRSMLNARKWHARGEKIAESLIPDRLRSYCNRKRDSLLRDVLDSAEYLKYCWPVDFAIPIRHLGYEPVIIISYRPFYDCARSRHLRMGANFHQLVDSYIAAYLTAVFQLEVLGGCVISYNRLVDPNETQWAEVLSQITGFEAERLLAARAERIKRASPAFTPSFDFMAFDSDLARLETQMLALSDRVILPDTPDWGQVKPTPPGH